MSIIHLHDASVTIPDFLAGYCDLGWWTGMNFIPMTSPAIQNPKNHISTCPGAAPKHYVWLFMFIPNNTTLVNLHEISILIMFANVAHDYIDGFQSP